MTRVEELRDGLFAECCLWLNSLAYETGRSTEESKTDAAKDLDSLIAAVREEAIEKAMGGVIRAGNELLERLERRQENHETTG